MTIARTSFAASLGIVLLLAAGSVGCGGSSGPPPAAAGSAGKSPSTMDSDDDGIFDDVDMCPTEKEDHKGSAPSDGCPDGKGKGAA
jgi:hypothetical protein